MNAVCAISPLLTCGVVVSYWFAGVNAVAELVCYCVSRVLLWWREAVPRALYC